MKSKLLSLTLVITLLVCTPCMTHAQDKPQNKPINNVTALLGYVAKVDKDFTVYIDTVDGNGWILENRHNLKQGKTYIIIYDTKGNMDLYDDEIINVVPI